MKNKIFVSSIILSLTIAFAFAWNNPAYLQAVTKLANGGTAVTVDSSGNLTNVGTINGITTYVATLTQSSTSAPVATVLLNTTGATITFARTSAGLYTATANSAIFTANKTAISFGPAIPGGAGTGATNIPSTIRTSTTVITLTTDVQNATTPASARTDGLLTETEIRINIYP